MQRYFETRFAVGDRKDAEFLQSQNNWEIVNAIMDAGVEGITSKQLAKDLSINYKVVADTAKHLAQMGWISSERPKQKVGRPPRGLQRRDFRKPSNIHVWSAIDSFEPVLSENFEDRCKEVFDKYGHDFQQFIDITSQVIAEMEVFPEFHPREPVHDCGWSHDGHEFLKGVLYAFLSWLESNPHFQEVLKKHKLATDKAFEDLPKTQRPGEKTNP
jgi:hypothetical protein